LLLLMRVRVWLQRLVAVVAAASSAFSAAVAAAVAAAEIEYQHSLHSPFSIPIHSILLVPYRCKA